MENFILFFIALSSICSIGAICYVIVCILCDRREPVSQRESASSRQRLEPSSSDVCLWAFLLVGLGAISLAGHLSIAHRVNKIYGNSEERRREK